MITNERYSKDYHRTEKKVDAIDLQLNEAITKRYQEEIERNNMKNVYYQSLIDYHLFQRAQMDLKEYPILTESGFNAITDIDAIKTDEFSIPSYSTYYNKDYKSKEVTFLELKQTKRLKTYNYWKDALDGDIDKRLFKGSNEALAMINGLRKEIETLVQIAKGSKIVVALTMDKTIVNAGYETNFYQYNHETQKMDFLSKQNRKADFKEELAKLTKRI